MMTKVFEQSNVQQRRGRGKLGRLFRCHSTMFIRRCRAVVSLIPDTTHFSVGSSVFYETFEVVGTPYRRFCVKAKNVKYPITPIRMDVQVSSTHLKKNNCGEASRQTAIVIDTVQCNRANVRNKESYNNGSTRIE